MGGGTVRQEAWSRARWFDLGLVRATLRVAREPGAVARDYVFGRRASVVHPLNLLFVLIGVLVILLGHTQYLKPDADSPELAQMFALITDYSKWSFSLGIIAIYVSVWTMFRRHEGYNATEKLVFAVYVHCACIVFQIFNQLPLLLWNDAAVLAWHKRWSPWTMGTLQAAVVSYALWQFFAVRDRPLLWRLGLAVIVYLGCKWSVQQAYARAVVEVVSWEMGM